MEDRKQVVGPPFAVSFFLAGSATSCAAIFTNPLEVVKTRFQLQNELRRHGERVYRNPFQAFGAVARAEGIRGLQTGLLTSMGYQVAIGGIRFSLYDPLRRCFHADETSNRFTMLENLSAGVAAGMIASIFGNPFVGVAVSVPKSTADYLMKTRLQAANSAAQTKGRYTYTSGLEGFRRIWSTDGLRGYFRGLSGAMPRVSLGSAAQIVSYDYFKSLLVIHHGWLHDGVLLHFCSSLIAGVFCVTAMNPFDVVSVRLYNQPVENGVGTLYRGPMDCIRQTVAQEGMLALQKGWVAQYFRLGPHTVLTMLFWERFQKMYHERI